jgi:hypothetical protein
MSSYEIKAETLRTGERVIGLHGEFDIHSLRDLSDALRWGASSGNATSVDLSGVTFADLCTLRELSDALLYYPGLSLNSPSWQVLQSARSCALEDRLGFGPAFAEISLKAS